MTLPEVDAFVKARFTLSIVGVDEQLEKLWIRGMGVNLTTGVPEPVVYEIALANLPTMRPTTLELRLHGESMVKHLSRITGYYSNTRVWNRSKIAELKDRGKGDYRVH